MLMVCSSLWTEVKPGTEYCASRLQISIASMPRSELNVGFQSLSNQPSPIVFSTGWTSLPTMSLFMARVTPYRRGGLFSALAFSIYPSQVVAGVSFFSSYRSAR